ncbi:MAG: molecular chaperone DnaK [Clostridia bacterium]|nr:molecular chaperone DnaK [Clostridia bacterium]
MSKAIGIDLGTTNSCVAVVEGGTPVIIPNERGSRTTPSVVAFTSDAQRLVGAAAVNQATMNAARTIASIKRQMGTDWKTRIDGRDWTPQEISAVILRKLRSDAESYLGEKVTDAVITVPAYFNDMQRQATKDAGRIAGLNVLRIINEPTSAALAYGLNTGTGQKVLVYDLGGGTFDVSVIEIGENLIEVLATCGDNHLGGDDFDARIVDWALEELWRTQQVEIRKDPVALARVREAAEQAKKELSTADRTEISLPYLTQKNGQPVHLSLALTRARFNELTHDLVERTAEPVYTALADAGISAASLSRVLLVGGSTRIPAVQEKVRQLTGKEPSRNINPDECVAQGAAIQAETLSGSQALSVNSSMLLLDVTPLSLSIETVGGVATRLIERNSTLPIHYSRVFTTAAPFQSSVEINVLQGERPMAADNKSIGRFTLRGIKRAMAGVPQIEVTFDLDTNGILCVSARDKDTGKEQSITITANDKMSEEEIQRAIRDAEQYARQDAVRREASNIGYEAQKLMQDVEKALSEKGKQIEKDEKKRITEAERELTRLISKKPEAMDASDLSAIRSAMDVLRERAARLMSL